MMFVISSFYIYEGRFMRNWTQNNLNFEYYIPNLTNLCSNNNASIEDILERTTHLCIAAHPDDVEIMAFHGINECFLSESNYFTAVIVTDGRGGERCKSYSAMSDDEFINVRKQEQIKASLIGEYNAVIFLNHSSEILKNNQHDRAIIDILNILNLSKPRYIYTHSPFDNHNTHTAVCNSLIVAAKLYENYSTIRNIYGCEVWGSLDWLPVTRKVGLDVSSNINLQRALLGVFDTQMARGKFFDEASIGKRKYNATFESALSEDRSLGLTYAIELKKTLEPTETLQSFITNVINEFSLQVKKNLYLL